MKKFIAKLRGLIEPPDVPQVPDVPKHLVAASSHPKAAEPSGATSKASSRSTHAKAEDTVSVEQLWDRYKKWLGKHFKQSLKELNPGVSEEHLVILERSINNNLPADYRNWLKIHNGQSIETIGLLYNKEFLSVSRVLEKWLGMKNLLNQGDTGKAIDSTPEHAIMPVWWSTSWLPISLGSSGNMHCIDLAPGNNGVTGQVIDVNHDRVRAKVLANSFTDYVVLYLDDLKAKNIVMQRT